MPKLRAWRRVVLMGVCVAIALTWAATTPAGDVLLYNPSASMPIGFYRRAGGLIGRGTIVTVRARDVAPEYAMLRGFADEGDRFLKRVVGVSGDRVCSNGLEISLNDTVIATRTTHDNAGRTLPSWSGCHTLAVQDFFLLGDSADSFDSRYWGVVRREQIEGVWRPLFE